MEFIKHIQKKRGHEDHNIRLLSRTEVYEIEQDIGYWNRVVHKAQNQGGRRMDGLYKDMGFYRRHYHSMLASFTWSSRNILSSIPSTAKI
jgi:hypothetical protein